MERRKIYSVIGRRKIVCSLTDCQTWTLIENIYNKNTSNIYKIYFWFKYIVGSGDLHWHIDREQIMTDQIFSFYLLLVFSCLLYIFSGIS